MPWSRTCTAALIRAAASVVDLDIIIAGIFICLLERSCHNGYNNCTSGEFEMREERRIFGSKGFFFFLLRQKGTK